VLLSVEVSLLQCGRSNSLPHSVSDA